MRSRTRLLPLLLGGGLVTPVIAQPAPPLSLEWIMRGPEVVGREPVNVRWSPDGQWIYFSWLPPGTSWREPARLHRVRPVAGAVPEMLSRSAADSLSPILAARVTSRDLKRQVVSTGADLYLIELPTGAIRRLTETPGAAELSPSFDVSGQRVFFRRDLNLFAFNLTDWGVRQLTDIRPGPAPDSAKPTGQRAFLEQEERRLLEAVRDRRWRDSLDRAEQSARDARRAKTIYLGAKEQITALVPNPTGTHALILTRTPDDTRTAKVPAYVTSSGYTEEIDARVKVGDRLAKQRVGMITLATGAVRWIRPIPGDSTDRYDFVSEWGWNDAGSAALIVAESSDNTQRHVVRIDAGADTFATIVALRDSAWVGGPCNACGGWLAGDRGVWFVAELDGYSHLYTVGADGANRRQRTRGSWEVLQASLVPDRTRWALHTSEASPFERHFYLLTVDGGAVERLTTEVGGHEVTLSPDRRTMADVFSESNRPPELFVRNLKAGSPLVRLTTSPTPEWRAHPWRKPDIVMIPASDGVKVPARIYRPADVGAAPNGAAVIFVHGAGYLHNVHHYWSSYSREYMFHHLLAARGYLVLDIDYRASAGYGRDWRTAIYRHMGGRDLQDHVDGAKYLNAEWRIPFDRIGIYGGSYGGFITLMALFTEPKYFGAGAALRSVTDWAHYNHPYTANILNEPQGDSTAFRRSSPIYFAEGLEDPLLMAHGMVDVNVHFQDIVRLSQRLIELGKTRWELAVYPVEDHGFVRPDSWTDEYRRILELFDRWLVPK